ncbi:MAG: hypothetical protein SCK57_09660 [Bacillota bacterium]|nr:hypothetical protein [Bacillota bacterium]
MSIFRRLGYIIMAVGLSLAVWVTALEWVTCDVNHYMSEFEKQDWVPAGSLCGLRQRGGIAGSGSVNPH